MVVEASLAGGWSSLLLGSIWTELSQARIHLDSAWAGEDRVRNSSRVARRVGIPLAVAPCSLESEAGPKRVGSWAVVGPLGAGLGSARRLKKIRDHPHHAHNIFQMGVLHRRERTF
jgi:hypothetical protein